MWLVNKFNPKHDGCLEVMRVELSLLLLPMLPAEVSKDHAPILLQ
ncbi:MAG: hypothetical protein QXJ73_06990 [Candidatus Caldarchaeum sp.]